MTKERLGTRTPLYLKLRYNSRLQMGDLRLDTGTDAESFDRGAIQFFYGADTLGDDPTNDGNLRRQWTYIPTAGGTIIPQADTYTYDMLNRLTGIDQWQYDANGTAIPSVATQTYSYDRWGNRKITSATGGVNNYNPTYDSGSNRISGLGYDASGNITSDPLTSGTMTYDAENRLLTATSGGGASYKYDADGRRTRRITVAQETWQVYGIGGELLVEYAANASPISPQKVYGYRNGRLLVVADASETGDRRVQWLVQDHLGSTRIVVDGSGSLAGIRRHDFLPFGEELEAGVGIRSASIGYGGDSVRQKYTGYERDTETVLDYAQARYYNDIQGRFISPDVPFADQYEGDPQSWNLYTYVRNNPRSNSDPTGRVTCYYRKEDGKTIGCEDDPRVKVNVDNGTLTFTPKGGKSQVYDLNTQVNAAFVVHPGGYSAEDLSAQMQLRASALKTIVAGAGVASAAIVAAPTIGLAGGGAATLGLGAGVSTLTSSETAIATLAAQLQFTGTTAARYAMASRFVPLRTLASAILYGTRMADPQGTSGAIKIVQEIFVNGKKYNLEIIYREADKMILHFLYK